MKKYALRVIYLPNKDYEGFAPQLNKITIYSIILKALKESKTLADSFSIIKKSLTYASRTDKGVGALFQVVSFSSAKTPLINEINNYLPKDIRIVDMKEVNNDFHPRKDAIYRVYSYFSDIHTKEHLNELDRSIQMLCVKDLNFSNFCKKDPKRPFYPIRSIDKLSYDIKGENIHFKIQARGFLWEMCRRIFHHLGQITNGEINSSITHALLYCEENLSKPPPAPPEFLILEYIHYKEGLFKEKNVKTTQLLKKSLKEQIKKQQTKLSLLTFFQERL